jgi:hypothetical protein
MLLANGLYGNPSPRTASTKPKLPTAAQRRTVKAWATRPLGDATPAQLETAVRLLSAHPDADSAGYSPAKAARQRVEAELASRL